MVKPVKDEIFGSRRSVIRPLLQHAILENLFFISCLHRYNADPCTRYLLLQECFNEAEYQADDLERLLPFFRAEIPLGKIWFAAEEIHLRGIRSGHEKVYSSENDISAFLLRLIRCPGRERQGGGGKTGSSAVSPLSRFLRTAMQGRAGSTDIDFMILSGGEERLAILEEKCFLQDEGGSLGHGQYLSLRELLHDALRPEQKDQLSFALMFIDPSRPEEAFVYDFRHEYNQPAREATLHDERRGENRVLFNFSEMEQVEIGQFLGTMTFGQNSSSQSQKQ